MSKYISLTAICPVVMPIHPYPKPSVLGYGLLATKVKMEDFKREQDYELSPQEAQRLCSEGYVFVRIDGKEHNDGKPELRLYKFIGS